MTTDASGVAGRIDAWLSRREQSFEHMARSRRTGSISCYRAYSLLFLPFALLVLLALPLAGRELIWNIDGLGQYYPFFVREGSWIREIVGGLFAGRGLNVPLWEWNSGYGVDVLTSFDVYFDPLNLVSAITPPKLSEWVFQLLVVLRFYLSGLAFVFYCRMRGEGRLGTVLGALLYALCGAALTAVKWSSGIHALMLFPVVLAGAEIVLKRGRPWVFIAGLTILAVISYYFTYMACILLVGYLAIRVCMVEGKGLTPGRFLRWVGIFAGLVILCMLIAGIVLVPSALAVMDMGRVSQAKAAVPILYSFDYYMRMIGDFLSIHEVGSDTYQGFGGLAFLACLTLFSSRDQTALKRIVVVLFVLMCIPLFGSIMNGMNYATNRWAWAYALCIALVLVRAASSLISLNPRTRTVLVVGTCAYGIFLLVPTFRLEANVAGYAALVLSLLLLIATSGFRARRAVLAMTLAITLAVNGFYALSADEGGIANGQVPLGMAYSKHTTASSNSLACEVRDDSWWRYDAGQSGPNVSAPIARIFNNSLLLGVRGIDFYNSIYNDAVDQFHNELAVLGDESNFSYSSLQGRSDLMSLLGVKYYLFRGNGTDSLPYGFSAADTVVEHDVLDVPFSLVRSRTALSVGTGFSKAITKESYDRLTPLERQQVLLQAVVLESRESGNVRGAATVSPEDLSYESRDVPFEVTQASGVTCEEGRFVVGENGGAVTLATEGVQGADTLVFFSHLTYRGMKPSDFVSEEAKANMLWYRRANLLAQDLSFHAPVQYALNLKSDVSQKTAYIGNYTPENHLYGGKDTWLADLGYADEPVRSITITFGQAGMYTYDDLRVQVQKHELHDGWIKERQAASFEQVEQGCNRLAGTISNAEPEVLLLTIPYSDGWTAQVDGAPAKIMRADTAFMAIDLPAGEHRIELRYVTPGLVQGALVSTAGLACLVVLVVALRFRDRPRVRS